MPARINQQYTLTYWRIKPEQEERFVAAWQDMAAYFSRLPLPPGQGILLQSEDDPQLFYSFGPWLSMAAIQSMRADPESQAAFARLATLCDEATPGAFRVVAVSP